MKQIEIANLWELLSNLRSRKEELIIKLGNQPALGSNNLVDNVRDVLHEIMKVDQSIEDVANILKEYGG